MLGLIFRRIWKVLSNGGVAVTLLCKRRTWAHWKYEYYNSAFCFTWSKVLDSIATSRLTRTMLVMTI